MHPWRQEEDAPTPPRKEGGGSPGRGPGGGAAERPSGDRDAGHRREGMRRKQAPGPWGRGATPGDPLPGGTAQPTSRRSAKVSKGQKMMGGDGCASRWSRGRTAGRYSPLSLLGWAGAWSPIPRGLLTSPFGPMGGGTLHLGQQSQQIPTPPSHATRGVGDIHHYHCGILNGPGITVFTKCGKQKSGNQSGGKLRQSGEKLNGGKESMGEDTDGKSYWSPESD